jgi:hypothetical protein
VGTVTAKDPDMENAPVRYGSWIPLWQRFPVSKWANVAIWS